jgi:hypothetical protein
MAIITLTAIHPKPGSSWEDLQKQLKKGNERVRKLGGENVTTMVSMAAGPNTGTISLLSTSADWTSYGKLQDALMADPELQAMMADPKSPVASWSTYVSQTIPDM